MSLGVDAKDKVLIVDADPKLRETLPDLLKARGYPVVTAATGDEYRTYKSRRKGAFTDG